MPVARTPRRVSSTGSCHSDPESPPLKIRRTPSYSILPASTKAARASRSKSPISQRQWWKDNMRNYACLILIAICVILIGGWEVNSLRREIRLAAAVDTLSQGEELFAPTDLEYKFEEHLKTHLLQQKLRLGKSTPLSKSNGPAFYQPSVSQEPAVSSVSSGTDVVGSAIEDRLSQFKQRFKDGSAPTRITTALQRRRDEKKTKIATDSIAREEKIEKENIDKKPKIKMKVKETVRDDTEDPVMRSNLQSAPGNWRPRTVASPSQSSHCADLKRGVCSVVSCELQLCGCEGCPAHFMEHCCEVAATGERVPKVGPRIPLRVSRSS